MGNQGPRAWAVVALAACPAGAFAAGLAPALVQPPSLKTRLETFLALPGAPDCDIYGNLRREVERVSPEPPMRSLLAGERWQAAQAACAAAPAARRPAERAQAAAPAALPSGLAALDRGAVPPPGSFIDATQPPPSADPRAFARFIAPIEGSRDSVLSLDAALARSSADGVQAEAWGAARAVAAFYGAPDRSFAFSRPLANWLRDAWLDAQASGKSSRLSLILRRDGGLDLRADRADGGFTVRRAHFGRSTSYGQSWAQWLRSEGNTEPALIVDDPFEVKPGQETLALKDTLRRVRREYLSGGAMQEWTTADAATHQEAGLITPAQDWLSVTLRRFDVSAADPLRWSVRDPKGEEQDRLLLGAAGKTSVGQWLDAHPSAKALHDGFDASLAWTQEAGRYTLGGAWNFVAPLGALLYSKALSSSDAAALRLDALADLAKDPLVSAAAGYGGDDLARAFIRDLDAEQRRQLAGDVEDARKRGFSRLTDDPRRLRELADTRRHPATDGELLAAFKRRSLLAEGERECREADGLTGLAKTAKLAQCVPDRLVDDLLSGFQNPVVFAASALTLVPSLTAKIGTAALATRLASQLYLGAAFVDTTAETAVNVKQAYDVGHTSELAVSGTDLGTNLGSLAVGGNLTARRAPAH